MQNYTKEQISEIYTGWFKKLQATGRDHNEFLTVLIRASKFYFGIDEEWGNIKNYEGLYDISSFGRVKSLEKIVWNQYNWWVQKERILNPVDSGNRYLIVNLYKNCKIKTRRIHQLVCENFYNHIPAGNTMVVNHKDFIKINNFVYNLEIVTNRENSNQKHLKSTSKYVGVCWHKARNKWTAQIVINGKRKYLGLFTDEFEAHKAYQFEKEIMLQELNKEIESYE